MSLQIIRGKKAGAIRAVIYGVEGIGKSPNRKAAQASRTELDGERQTVETVTDLGDGRGVLGAHCDVDVPGASVLVMGVVGLLVNLGVLALLREGAGNVSYVARAVGRIKRETNRVQIVAGNIATYDGARALIDGIQETNTGIVAIVGRDSTMVIHHTHTGRPRDLINVALSLLDQALTMLHQDAMIEDNNDLMMQVAEAIDALPDRFEEPD